MNPDATKATQNLITAAANGNIEEIEKAIKEGANTYDWWAITVAAERGHLKAVKLLIENGANPKSMSAAMGAVKSGNLNILKYLLKNGAYLDDANLIIVAASIGNLEILNFLFENGSNINGKLDPALTSAIRSGNLKIVKFLIKKECPIIWLHVQDAIEFDHLEMVKYITKKYIEQSYKKLKEDPSFIYCGDHYTYIQVFDYAARYKQINILRHFSRFITITDILCFEDEETKEWVKRNFIKIFN